MARFEGFVGKGSKNEFLRYLGRWERGKPSKPIPEIAWLEVSEAGLSVAGDRAAGPNGVLVGVFQNLPGSSGILAMLFFAVTPSAAFSVKRLSSV